MSRRDFAADLDRPHFYSQYWIDVAMGKRDVTAAPTTEAEADAEFEEADEPEFEPVVKVVAPPPVAVRKPAKAPERKPEPARPITSLADLANIDLLMKSSAEMDGDEVPDIEAGPTSDLAPIVTDFDLADAAAEPEAAAAEDEDFADGEFEDEEEEDEWGTRRKPSKPQKTERRRERPEKRTF